MKSELDSETKLLWNEYLAAERVRVRQESLQALERFCEALLRHSPNVWEPWARELAMGVVDEHQEIPIRLPLFRLVIFPALRSGLDQSIPGTARCLAGLAQVLYKSPACYEQLPEEERSEYGLLLRAIRDDPTDIRAKKRLLNLMRSRFDYVLHELPDGVLYGHDGATVKQCDELLVELSDYERLAKEIGLEDCDQRLIAEARYHLPAYQDYLLHLENYASYEEYLSARKDV